MAIRWRKYCRAIVCLPGSQACFPITGDQIVCCRGHTWNFSKCPQSASSSHHQALHWICILLPGASLLCQALLLCVLLPDAAEEHVSNSWENDLWLNKMLQIAFLFMLICHGWWFLVFLVSIVVCYKTICKRCLKLKWDHRGFCVMFWKHLALQGDFSHPSEKLDFHFL